MIEVKVKIVKSHQQARVDETKTKEVNIKIKNASKERWTVPNKTLGTKICVSWMHKVATISSFSTVRS